MSPRATRRASADALVAHLGDPTSDPLVGELDGWLRDSPGFRRFVDAHRDKIRKKLRTTPDPDARRDLRAELAVARALLNDRRIELLYEPGGLTGGPDFAVAYRESPAFNLEVTHPRGIGHAGSILTKLRQLPSGAANVVLLAADGPAPDGAGIEAAVRSLRIRADAKDEAFFVTRGFAGTRAFYDRFLRLGAVISWTETAPPEGRAAIWVNRSARIAVPPAPLRACTAALRADA